MDASADFPMNDDEPARNVIEIPSSDRATALEFAIDRLQHALRDPTCSLVEFTTADADINLRDLWEEDMEERVKRQQWAIGVHLSRVSKSFLYVRREGERHRDIKHWISSAISHTVGEAGLLTRLEVKSEAPYVMEKVGIDGAEETMVPDISICSRGEPLVWFELADSQIYKDAVEKMMLVSASCPSVKKFAIIHLYPAGAVRHLSESDREFSMDFQVFDPLLIMRQLSTGQYCTLSFRPHGRRNPAADHLPQNEVPQPENRTPMQRFDLFLSALRVFQFTNVQENPVFRIFGDDNILRLRFSAILRGSHRSRIITLAIDMTPVLDLLQQDRDAFAARAAQALGDEPQPRFTEQRINNTIEPSFENVRQIPRHISNVLEHRAFEEQRGHPTHEGNPGLDMELLVRN